MSYNLKSILVALGLKQNTLVSGTTIKTINGSTLLGSGDLVVADATKLAILNNLSDLNNVATARTNIGLGNVDNTSDINKPVSTAQQTALNLKAPLISPTLVTPVLGVATATTINGATIISGTLNGTVTGTNTGDNATNSQYSGLATSKQDTLVSATNIKTINGSTLLGSGNLVVSTPDQDISPSSSRTIATGKTVVIGKTYIITGSLNLTIQGNSILTII